MNRHPWHNSLRVLSGISLHGANRLKEEFDGTGLRVYRSSKIACRPNHRWHILDNWIVSFGTFQTFRNVRSFSLQSTKFGLVCYWTVCSGEIRNEFRTLFGWGNWPIAQRVSRRIWSICNFIGSCLILEPEKLRCETSKRKFFYRVR